MERGASPALSPGGTSRTRAARTSSVASRFLRALLPPQAASFNALLVSTGRSARPFFCLFRTACAAASSGRRAPPRPAPAETAPDSSSVSLPVAHADDPHAGAGAHSACASASGRSRSCSCRRAGRPRRPRAGVLRSWPEVGGDASVGCFVLVRAPAGRDVPPTRAPPHDRECVRPGAFRARTLPNRRTETLPGRGRASVPAPGAAAPSSRRPAASPRNVRTRRTSSLVVSVRVFGFTSATAKERFPHDIGVSPVVDGGKRKERRRRRRVQHL